MDDEWRTKEAERLEVVSGRLGSITLYALTDPVAVLAIAKGAISLRVIRREIDVVTKFAEQHPQGWCYLADVRGVRLLNPLNLVALRRISRLPGVRRRVIVVPRLARRLEPIAVGELTSSVADARARC